MNTYPPQAEFNFDSPQPDSGGDGFARWRVQRERTLHRLARRVGLPLDHEVEVWLKNGMKLQGKLQLKESMLFIDATDERALEFQIGRANFRHSDIESCVRLD